MLANTNSAAPFSMNLRYGTGEFYDGYRRNYTVGGTFRLNEHLNVSLSDSDQRHRPVVRVVRDAPGHRAA